MRPQDEENRDAHRERLVSVPGEVRRKPLRFRSITVVVLVCRAGGETGIQCSGCKANAKSVRQEGTGSLPAQG